VWNCYIPLHCCFLNLQVSLLCSQGQIFAETTQLAASCITMEAIRFKFQQSVKYCRYCALSEPTAVIDFEKHHVQLQSMCILFTMHLCRTIMRKNCSPKQ
jgi:hypothetical protein